MDETVEHKRALHAINSKSRLMLMVHLPGCSHCEAMKNDWIALKDHLPPGIVVAAVRAGTDAHKQLPADVQEKAEKGYPLVVAITTKGEVVEYESGSGEPDGEFRTTNDMKAFAMKVLGGAAPQKGGRRRRTRKSRRRKSRKRTRRRRRARPRTRRRKHRRR
tara:strand:+ start:5672 stop:6157 length:486 start_codon:yes stop_codon:yes gene_type:complete